MDDDIRDILKLLRETAQGKHPTVGRDEVAIGPRMMIGGLTGRALTGSAEPIARSDRERRIRLHIGPSALDVGMISKGEFVFEHGDLHLEVADRHAGGVLVDAMADWLGTPMASAALPPSAPPERIIGEFAKLGTRNDADGVAWDVFKLFVGKGDDYAEMFLRVTTTDQRAAFTEKWSRYRERLLRVLDRALGCARDVADRRRVEVHGGAWFSVPPDWIITLRADSVVACDGRDEASLEVSHQPYPIDPRLPGLRVRLVAALGDHRAAAFRATEVDRGDFEYVWTEYEYDATDSKTGASRLARSRVLVAANHQLQALMTYAYWPTDEGWAVPAWQTIVSTLRLASHEVDPTPDAAGHR
jgi:hypothetical protein